MAAQHCACLVFWSLVRPPRLCCSRPSLTNALRENLPGPSGSAFLQACDDFRFSRTFRSSCVIRLWSCEWAKLAHCSFGCVTIFFLVLQVAVCSADICVSHGVLRLPNGSPCLLEDCLCLQSRQGYTTSYILPPPTLQKLTKTRKLMQDSRTTATLAMFPNGLTHLYAPFGSRPS